MKTGELFQNRRFISKRVNYFKKGDSFQNGRIISKRANYLKKTGKLIANGQIISKRANYFKTFLNKGSFQNEGLSFQNKKIVENCLKIAH